MDQVTISRELLRQVLDALGPEPPECCGCAEEWRIAITALRTALEQPAVEPVASDADMAESQIGYESARSERVKEHISTPDCWCCPELDYVDPDTGAEVWVHKGVQ